MAKIQKRSRHDCKSLADSRLIAISALSLLFSSVVSADDMSTTDEASRSAGNEPAVNQNLNITRTLMAKDRKGVIKPDWLEHRAISQVIKIANTKVFHNFGFSDRIKESGIQFRNRVVPDGGKNFKPAHYDHGNGITVADVDDDGLYDIYFVNSIGGNELWRNLGNGKFKNITESAGVSVKGRISVSASFADIDNDGDPDLYVTTVRGGNVLFENMGAGKFRDISKSSGLDYTGHSSSAVFFDYDRDGLVDMFLVNVGKYTTDIKKSATTNYPDNKFRENYDYYVAVKNAFQAHNFPGHNERSLLFRNTGNNRFVDVTKKAGLNDESWSGDATVLDLNEDGWQDLYVLNMQGHDEYYENIEGKRFVKKSREIFPATSWGAMGIKSFDYNNDGRMDIYITDMHTDMVKVLAPAEEKNKMHKIFDYHNTDGNLVLGNSFFRNEGNGKFKEVSDAVNVENFWPWGLSVGDVNADGFQDIFVTASMNMVFRYGTNNLLLNNHGKKFLDSEFVLGVEPRLKGKTAKPWFRLDCDGIDINHRNCRERTGTVEYWEALGSRSSVIFDLDNDGDLDIVTNEWNWYPMVLVSNLSEKKEIRYLKVSLDGTKSNRDGLGARVTVHAAGKAYTQVQDGTSGYLSHSIYPLYFGLGNTGKVDKIEVTWPSGTRQVVKAPIKINSLIEITEPDS